jgi:hypothetical protein
MNSTVYVTSDMPAAALAKDLFNADATTSYHVSQ